MNYYEELLDNSIKELLTKARKAKREASLNTIDTIRRILRDMERNDKFTYENVVEVLERLENIHMEDLDR